MQYNHYKYTNCFVFVYRNCQIDTKNDIERQGTENSQNSSWEIRDWKVPAYGPEMGD